MRARFAWEANSFRCRNDRFDAIGGAAKGCVARPHTEVCALVRSCELGVFGLAVDVRHDDAFVTRPRIVVGFPVADALFSATMAGRWSMSHAVRNQPRPEFCPYVVVLLYPVTQLEIKGSRVFCLSRHAGKMRSWLIEPARFHSASR